MKSSESNVYFLSLQVRFDMRVISVAWKLIDISPLKKIIVKKLKTKKNAPKLLTHLTYEYL